MASKRQAVEVTASMALVAFVVLISFMSALAKASELQCVTPYSDTVRVSLISRRNRTGHWVSEVVMHKHQASSEQLMKGEGTWAVAVEQEAISCGRAESELNLKLILTASPPKPGPDYELFPGLGYFKFHPKPQTWAKAREICEQEWAHLAIVNSEKEADLIAKQLFGRFPKIEGAAHQDWAWIGLEKEVATGSWVTVLGESLNSTGYMRWYSGRPQAGTTNCVLIHKNAGTLHDNPCSVVDAFVCEREL